MLLEGFGPDDLVRIGVASLQAERGGRVAPHGVFKWWGRRFSVLSRAVLAGLVLGEGESGLEDVLSGRPPGHVRRRARGVLVVDPFSGAGTIPLEAGYLGFDSLGIDISRSAVMVARATSEIVGGRCEAAVRCLESALLRAWGEAGRLWSPGEDTVVHAFLARCASEECRVPSLLSVRRRGGDRECVIITSGGTRAVRGGECSRYGPVEPLAEARGPLPWAGPGVRAYAVELSGPGGRRFVSFSDPEWPVLAGWLERTAREASVLAGNGCTPLPRRGEAARLRRSGLECWEQVFTPRQLASLQAFIAAAEEGGCGWLARVVVASVSRSASLLAIYYQPAGKVNPGLVIKGYWLPQYPVELNPLAWRPSREGPPLPLGRGGVASVVRRAWRACLGRRLPAGARVRFRVGDARDPESYPERIGHVVTDPPYPGMQDYQGLSAIYDYWLGQGPGPRPGRDHTETILDMLSAVRPRLEPGGYVVLLLGAGLNHLDRLARIVLGASLLYGLRRVYWLPGESPGGLGRSRARGVFVVVARSGAPHSRAALEPLEWTGLIAEKVNRKLGKRVVDPELEQERALSLASLIRRGLALREDPLDTPRPHGPGLH